jgi:hypothetical protein
MPATPADDVSDALTGASPAAADPVVSPVIADNEAPVPDPSAMTRGPRSAADGLERVLWWCAGVSPDIMRQRGCLTDWGRFSALGAVTLVTACLATLNGAVVSYFFVLGRHVVPSLLAGLGWGLIVLSLDRLLLISLAKKPNASGTALAIMAAPRVALAVLIALLISTPAELVLFHHQLDVQVAMDQQAEVVAQKGELDRRWGDIDVARARREELVNQDEASRQGAQQAFAAASCEGDGSCGSGLPGAGILHAEKAARFRQLQADAVSLQSVNGPEIASLNTRIAAMDQARERQLAAFAAVTVSGDDVLSRLLALRHLENDPVHGSTVTGAKWLIRLLSLAIELLPLMTKILTRGPYDAAFFAEREGQCAHFDSARESAVERAAIRAEQERMLGRAVLDTSAALLQQAVTEALTSETALAARRDLADEVVARSVAISRETAADVFGDSRLRTELTQAALAARRERDAEAASAHARAADTLRNIDESVAAAENLSSDPRSEMLRNVANDQAWI